MNTVVKTLIPNKSWLIEQQGEKIGTLQKEKSLYSVLQNGQKYEIGNAKDVKEQLGIELPVDVKTKKVVNTTETTNTVYNFPCSSKPYNPLYNVRKKLPIYAKSTKSKSQYCAGYYVIKFRKGWVKSFCPKLITLERYPFEGPFRTEQEMRQQLNTLK
jgi:hypothetical protein